LDDLSLRTDNVIVGYLLATGALVSWFHADVKRAFLLVALHAIGALIIWSLRRLPPRLPVVAQFFRDWYPMIVFPIFYKEVEVLAGAFGNWALTERLQSAEVRLFAGHPSLFLSERLAFVPLSEYLHFCYFAFVLLVPVIGGLWYFNRARDSFRELVFLVSVTFALSYLFYILFPVDSPFYLSEPPGAPLSGHFFYELVHVVSSHGGARGGAFPSSHVSISTVVLLVTWKHRPRWLVWLAPIYVGLVVATVYGRFHYVVDVFAGWALALTIVAGYELRARAQSRHTA